MRFFSLFFKLVNRNCLIFGTKVTLDKSYALEILKLFGKVLIALNPLKNHKFGHFGRQKFLQKSEKNYFGQKNQLFTVFTHFMTSLSQHNFCCGFFPKIAKYKFRVKNYVTLGLKWVTRVGPRMSACFG